LLTNTLIAPNPVHNETTVYFGEEGSKTLQLINLNGNILRTDNIGPSINRYTIKLDKLSPGLYLLRIQTTNGTTTHKIIKQ
ncbi:MAG: T9SS type A sorting domain-containing protein, partial [Chitinophagaceae bacterium]